jgi:ABC-2 type transport system permease protein
VRVVFKQIVGDRTTLFFLLVLPVVVIVVIGATFGSAASFEIGVVRPAAGDAASTELASSIEQHLVDSDGTRVRVYDDRDELEGAVRRQALSLGVVFADDLDTAITTGGTGVEIVADPTSQSAQAALDLVRSAVAAELAPRDAARFAAGLAGVSIDEAATAATIIQPGLPRVTVTVEDIGDARRGDLSTFSLTAPQNLVLFVFINAMAGGAALVRMRRMGVLRRVVAGPIGAGDVVIGVTAAWFLVSLLQSLLIVTVGALVFGVSWGDPIAAGALIIVFSAVGAGAGLLVGSMGGNEDRVSAISPPAGIVLGALGGCMVPLEVFPDGMLTVAKAVPHYWAMTAWQRLVFDGDGIGAIAIPLVVLSGFATVFVALATRALHRGLTRG